MIGIYKIENNINNKVYIGSSIDIENRWKNHKKLLILGKHHSKKLQRSYEKYGEFAFSFHVIEECSSDLLIIKEQYYIDILDCYKNGYNSTPIAGIGFNTGIKHSEETKEKLRILGIGNKNMLGKKHTDKTKEKIREKLKGLKLSDETKKKMSESQKNRIYTVQELLRISDRNKLKSGKNFEEIYGKEKADIIKEKISVSHLGKKQNLEVIKNRAEKNTGQKRTEEQKKRMSDGMKGVKKGPMSESNKKLRCKKIALLSDSGDVIKEFESIKECAKELNIDIRRILEILHNRPTYKKYIHLYFKYI